MRARVAYAQDCKVLAPLAPALTVNGLQRHKVAPGVQVGGGEGRSEK